MVHAKSRAKEGVFLWPLILYFFIIGTSGLQTSVFYDAGREGGSLINQVFLSAAYLMAFFLLLKRGNLFRRLLMRAFPLVTMILFIGLSISWSMFPQAVLMSFAHQLGVTFIAMCAAILWKKDKNIFFKMFLNASFFYLLITIIASHFFPRLCHMVGRLSCPGGQWRGFTTHYNTLGSFCLVMVWMAVAGHFLVDEKNKQPWVVFFVFTASFYCLYRSNSMTATLLSIALVLSALWFIFTRSSYGQTKGRKIVFFVFISSLMAIGAFLIKPDIFTKEFFFELIGRNETLTGRTTLWELGFKGISSHPYVGWSFDSLRSFSKHFLTGYGQLHNGYFDLILRGGAVAGVLFFLIVFKIIQILRKMKAVAYPNYYFGAALLVAILVHNVTEASFFRNAHVVWGVFLVLYFYCLLSLNRERDALQKHFDK